MLSTPTTRLLHVLSGSWHGSSLGAQSAAVDTSTARQAPCLGAADCAVGARGLGQLLLRTMRLQQLLAPAGQGPNLRLQQQP